jgi:gag-polypeptide of LTR copia-type
LCNKHDPSTAATLVQLKKEFATHKLKKVSVDPGVLITELEVLRRRMKACGHIMTDDDIIIHVISNLPKDYDAICDQLEIELGDEDQKQKITILDIKNRLRNKYNKLKVRVKSIGEDSGDCEKLMSIKGHHKKLFKGKCHNCGKYGHRISDCLEKKRGGIP